jgi:hypothetical protein
MFIKTAVELLLKLIGLIVPENYKVYAVSLIGIIAGAAMAFLGDPATGMMMVWFGFMGLVGRYTAAKVQNQLTEVISGQRKAAELSPPNLPEIPVPNDPTVEARVF